MKNDTNKVEVSGRIYTESYEEDRRTSFMLSVHRAYERDGDWKHTKMMVPITIWDKLRDELADEGIVLGEGMHVRITGNLSTYRDKINEDLWRFSVTARSLEYVETEPKKPEAYDEAF